ncbi:MAG: PD40 domain-containing protein [Acidobacteria bacterium]|nr:PD40 domain-containing protein [Acidobacteriota bacterium]
MESPADGKFRFENFELDCAKRVLKRDGEPVALKSKTIDLLQHLVENHGRLITKQELLDCVWPEQFVEENNLTVQISALRKVFGPGQFIATIPGKGYKFVAEVSQTGVPEELIIEQRSFSRITIEEHESRTATETERASRGVSSTALKAIAATATVGLLLLSTLGFVYWRQTANAGTDNYKLAKLTTSGDITSATITPDGNYTVFARKEAGGESLWLRQIASGSQQQIVAPKPIRYVGLTVTPDGRSIYATTFSPELPDPQVWQMPLLGGDHKVIDGVTSGAAVSFSPDGEKIAYTESRSSMNETQLLTSNANGTDKKVIRRATDGRRSFPNFNANPVAWSPDGSVIAAAVEQSTDSVKCGIILADPENKTEKYATDRRWDVIEHLAWIDSDTLAFIGYTIDPWIGQVWTVSRSSGEVRQITNDLSNYSWLASTGGKILTVQRNSSSHISVNDLNFADATASGRAVRAESGEINQVAFAPDGSILFGSSATGKREIWKMDADGSNAKQLTANANITFGLSVSSVDGSMVFCSSENGKHLLKLADADGRNIRLLTDGPEDVNPNFTPDGRSVIFQKGLNNKTVTLWRMAIDGGSRKQLTQTSGVKPTVSPDGSKVAYYFMDQTVDGLWKVGIISTDDGTPLNKLSFPKPVTERQMQWLADGSAIGQIFYEGDRIDLLVMPLDGSGSKLISDVGRGEVQSLAFSRDGKKLAISYTEQRPDVVLISR